MTYDPDIHHRRSIRLRDYDYSTNGAYFVTIRTHVGAGFPRPECLFGGVVGGIMELNEVGQMVEEWWAKSPDKFPGVVLDEFIIMPNHFHGIVVITDHVGAGSPRPILIKDDVGAGFPRPLLPINHKQGGETPDNQTQGGVTQGGETPPLRRQPTLGHIVGYFKCQTTKQINQMCDNPGVPVWQRNYYERVIRNEDELQRVRKYIAENPLKWAQDKENPENVP